MSELTTKIAEQYRQKVSSNAHLKIACSIEHMEKVANTTLKVVAAFNREPTATELAETLDAKTGRMLRIIPNSFFEVKNASSDKVLSGYMTLRSQKRSSTKGLMALAKNTFMDKNDNSIWKIKDGTLIKTASEDIDDIIESVEVTPYNKGNPITASVNVPNKYGPDNTQLIYYVDPTMRTTQIGIRVGDDNVLCFDDQNTVEIASNLVIAVKNLHKVDMLPEEKAAIDSEDQAELIDYYRQVFDFNPDYFERLTEIIRGQAFV